MLHVNGHGGGVQQLIGGDARQDEVAGFQGLGALGGGADAHGGDGVADGQIEAALLRQGAGIGDDGQGVHLELVVVVKAQGLVDPDSGIQPEAGLFQALLASGVAGIEDGHIVLFRQGVDGGEEADEVLLRVDVLLPVGGEQDVFVGLQAQAVQHVATLDLVQVHSQHLGHGGAGLVGALFRQAGVGQVLPGELRVAQVHVGNHVHDPAVGFLRQALVLAAVAGLHVENGDVQPLGGDGRQAGIGVPQHQQGIGLEIGHNLVGLGQDVAAGLSQVLANHMEQNVRAVLPGHVFQLEILPKNSGEVLVPVLVGVDDAGVKVLPAALHNGGQPDDLRPGAADDHAFQPTVVFPLKIHLLLLRQPLLDVAQGRDGVDGLLQI